LKLYIEPSIGSQISEENIAFPKSKREYLKKYMNQMEKIALACSRARRSRQKSQVRQANARARKLTKRAGKRLFNVIEEASKGSVRHFRELGDEWENLVLRVDDHTRGYPWELAFDGEDFMCTRFVVARKAVARESIFLPRQKPLHKDALVIGIDYDWPKCKYSELDHCEYEARSVITQLRKLHYRIHQLMGKDATVEKARKLLSKGVGVFHFTGHGNYRTHSAEGKKGLLCLADGELTTKDLRECFEKSRGAPYLSFLNACRSAKEIYSSELIDAFVDLGAENVIGTFWSVLDAPSKIFARKFYSSLTQHESIGFATRKAREQLALVRKKDEDTTWPAFVFYGDPNMGLPDARTFDA
jgi:CHAT domain-containing protein